MYGGRSFTARKRLNDGRRSRLDLIADILDTSLGGVKKTHLMYHCNMSFAQLEKYLNLILKTKLIVVEDDGPRLFFKTSGKGRRFLMSYESLKALME